MGYRIPIVWDLTPQWECHQDAIQLPPILSWYHPQAMTYEH